MLRQQHFVFSCKVTRGGKGPSRPKRRDNPVRTAPTPSKPLDYQGVLSFLPQNLSLTSVTENYGNKAVMLINTSRGKLIDTDAANEALKEGRLGYLGIDVYEQEEKLFYKDLSEIVILDDKISRLMTFPDVLVTAHQAFLLILL